MRRTCALLAALVVMLAVPAYAFNAAGHQIIAEIAWRKLSPQQRSTIVAVLRQHPRFNEDFQGEMPSQIASQGVEAQDHWLFCQAAIWPDIARDLPEYHRGRWHYINLPLFLSASQAASMSGSLTVNVSFSLPSSGNDTMLNGVQAVKNSLLVVQSSTPSAADKAVHYCWLMHVIPDLAQPLHSTALFAEQAFPGGDQGGNRIKIRKAGTTGSGKKLHAVWDGLLGTTNNFNSLLTKADSIIQNHQVEFNAPFTALPNDVWATETQLVAAQSAYGPLLGKVRDADEDGHAPGVIEMPATYYSDAGQVIQKQAVMAGVRLAGVLISTVPAPGGPGPFLVGAPGVDMPAVIALQESDQLQGVSPAALPHVAHAATHSEESLEHRVARLEALIAAQAEGMPSPAGQIRSAMAGATDGAASDDGDQCDCGAD